MRGKKMHNKESVGYRIGRGYNTITVWHFDKKTRKLISTSTRTTNRKTMSRPEKYKGVVCEVLKEYGIEPPEYMPTVKEKRRGEKTNG